MPGVKWKASTSQLWLYMAMLVAANNMALYFLTQALEPAIMATLIWGGAFLCVEDRLDAQAPAPSYISFWLGFGLVLAGLWRSTQVFHLDTVVYILPLVQGLGLALMLMPARQLPQLVSPLAILSLAVLALVPLKSYLPEETLSLFTARITAVLLNLVGQDAYVSGREVWLPAGGVRVSGPCSGRQMITQLFVVSIIFVLAFPLRRVWIRLAAIALAPLFAIFSNCFRIAVLALINASQMAEKTYWFNYFHEDEGSLVFAAIGTSMFAWLYLKMIDRQLMRKDSKHG